MKELYKKLLEVQKEVKAISKDSTNPFFNSQYFDINKLVEVLKPILSDKGLVLLQPLCVDTLTTQIVDAETGDVIQSSIKLPEGLDAQKMGAAITYFRRYTLQSLLALQAEDDDANSVSGSGKGQNTGWQPKAPQNAKSGLTERPTSSVTAQKKEIVRLLLEKDLSLKRKQEAGEKISAEDYEESVRDLAGGMELLPGNYDTIIGLLKQA